jgi:uncharacterized protein (DUF58 family)
VGDPRDPGRRRRAALIGALRRALRPPRQLRPTRAGWIFFALVFAVGFAALNTGNNLLYLVLSLMLAFLVLSGVLSEAALRGIEVERRLPFELVAGRPARVVLEIGNSQARIWAHAIAVEDFGAAGASDAAARLGGSFALRIGPRQRERRSYRFEPACRGALRFQGFRVITRFPFGLFAKSLWIERPAEVIVYPTLAPAAPPPARDAVRSLGDEQSGRSDDESEVAGLRAFAPGDAPRRVHWRASWRRSALLVRDAEGDASGETEVVLHTRGAAPGDLFERAVERAAAQAEAGLLAGLRVGLRTDGAALVPAAGAVHRARLLGYLALIQPERSEGDKRARGPEPARSAGDDRAGGRAQRGPGEPERSEGDERSPGSEPV